MTLSTGCLLAFLAMLLLCGIVAWHRNHLVYRYSVRWLDALHAEDKRSINAHYREMLRRVNAGLPREPYPLGGINPYQESDRWFGSYDRQLYRMLGKWRYEQFYPLTPREYLDELVREKAKAT